MTQTKVKDINYFDSQKKFRHLCVFMTTPRTVQDISEYNNEALILPARGAPGTCLIFIYKTRLNTP